MGLLCKHQTFEIPGMDTYSFVSFLIVGKVRVNGRVINKAGTPVSDEAVVEINAEIPKYVCRWLLWYETLLHFIAISMHFIMLKLHICWDEWDLLQSRTQVGGCYWEARSWCHGESCSWLGIVNWRIHWLPAPTWCFLCIWSWCRLWAGINITLGPIWIHTLSSIRYFILNKIDVALWWKMWEFFGRCSIYVVTEEVLRVTGLG